MEVAEFAFDGFENRGEVHEAGYFDDVLHVTLQGVTFIDNKLTIIQGRSRHQQPQLYQTELNI